MSDSKQCGFPKISRGWGFYFGAHVWLQVPFSSEFIEFRDWIPCLLPSCYYVESKRWILNPHPISIKPYSHRAGISNRLHWQLWEGIWTNSSGSKVILNYIRKSLSWSSETWDSSSVTSSLIDSGHMPSWLLLPSQFPSLLSQLHLFLESTGNSKLFLVLSVKQYTFSQLLIIKFIKMFRIKDSLWKELSEIVVSNSTPHYISLIGRWGWSYSFQPVFPLSQKMDNRRRESSLLILSPLLFSIHNKQVEDNSFLEM